MLKKLFLLKTPSLIFLATVNLLLFSYLLFLAYFNGRMFPGIKISGISQTRQTPVDALNTLSASFQSRQQDALILSYQDQKFEVDLNEAQPEINLNQVVDQAYSTGRSGDYLKDFQDQFQALVLGKSFTPQVKFKKEIVLTSQINGIARAITKDPTNAQVSLGENISVTSSQDGQKLDNSVLSKQINDYLSLTAAAPTQVPVAIIKPGFSTANAQAARASLEKIKTNPITLHFEDNSWTIDQKTLFNLLDFNAISTTTTDNILPKTSALLSSNNFSDQLLINQEKLTNFLKDVASKINQPVAEAKFQFDSQNHRVTEFQAAQQGQELDIEKTAQLLSQALTQNGKTNIDLPVKKVLPKVTTADANNLGINKLLGEGVSNFAGSITNRIFNIGLAASRLNGALVPPGETFSFNKTVGEISGATGYKQAYVIKSGRTVLDDGGGVCQVSTTLFRAALNSGVPITERTAHAYRVGYYEQGFPPGLDATVFSPSVDFKFKNDTPAHILVQARVEGTTLYIDLYGTDDGRISKLTTPVILSQTPPLPELRQDDPTLPKGEVKQVDWPAWGANVSFSRTVTKNGETLISESWKSNYRSWQAVYLVGTKE